MTDTLAGSTSGSAPGLTPPQALDAERSILAAMMLDAGAIGRAVEVIDSGVFYRSAHAKIFDALIGLYTRNEAADIITVSEELKKRGDYEAAGGASALAQIMESATTIANIEHHIKIVHSKAILRSLIRVTGEIQQQCYGGHEETANILDQAEARIFGITDQRIREGFTSIHELLKPTFDNIQKLFERKVQVTGVPSGWDDLDKLTSGWQPGDLVILAGRPSMGKSSCAVNMAENAAIRHGTPVVIFSLEMSKEQLVQRLLTSEGRVDAQRLRKGKLHDDEFVRLGRAAGILSHAPIWIDDTPAMNLLEMRSKARRLRMENNIGMVVVDYLQLMQGPLNTESRQQEISYISRSLKALARELRIPVVALSQLSRAPEQRTGENKRPQLSDLRESGAIEQDADLVMFIYRQEMYDGPTDKDGNSLEGRAEVIVGKQRNGPTGFVNLYFNKTYTRFENLSPRLAPQ